MKKNDDDILLFVIILLLLVSVIGCKHKPEFYIDGKPCRTYKRCVKEELKWQPYGPRFAMECVEWKIDTVEIKPEELECQK